MNAKKCFEIPIEYTPLKIKFAKIFETLVVHKLIPQKPMAKPTFTQVT